MSSAEEITIAIEQKGNEIKAIKAAKPPTLKEDLVPLVAELLALKVSFKSLTGEDFGGKPAEEKPKAAKKEEVAVEREGPSKAELNKIARKEKAAAAKAAEREAKGGDAAGAAAGGASAPRAEAGTEEGDAALAYLFGDAPLVQSATMTDRRFKYISELNADDRGVSKAGQTVWMRARVANSRAVGKGVFLILRQNLNTCQAILWQGPQVPKAMVKYAQGVSLESIVDILAEVVEPQEPILSVTLKSYELHVREIHIVSKVCPPPLASILRTYPPSLTFRPSKITSLLPLLPSQAQDLPFLIDDAGRNEDDAVAKELPTVTQDTALNFRWVDLRTPANQAIFRIQSGVCQLFREFLSQRGFIEIHTPKLISGASEGGSNVFTLKYFDQPACLAQSPQLYKQMAAACGGLDRVFEIGPVFRAENSNTHRHLCEFTGLDFEMAIGAWGKSRGKILKIRRPPRCCCLPTPRLCSSNLSLYLLPLACRRRALLRVPGPYGQPLHLHLRRHRGPLPARAQGNLAAVPVRAHRLPPAVAAPHLPGGHHAPAGGGRGREL